jgi:tRNA nucleotidyltransferase (CCA-adding enzyme)
MDVVAGHPNTDFDAFASMLACRRLYPGAVVALTGSLNRNVREFARLHADELELVDASRLDASSVTRVVLVEVSDPERLGELGDVLRRPDVEVVLFDHHGEPPEWVPAGSSVLSDDGALTTTLVGILAEREIPVTPLEATAFALGIHEDTGSLTFATSTLRDAEALAWCLRHGASQEMVSRYLHQPLVAEERELLDALVSSLEPVSVGGLDVLVAAVAWPRYVDGVSNLAHKIVDLTDARALVCLVEMDGRVVGVFRSRAAEVDAAALAASLGGGGHPQAASATFHGPLDDARARLTAALSSAARELPRARNVMSRPPRFVSPDDTVAHAMALCQRHRQSGIQVGGRRDLRGVVTREDLDKAIGHGLSGAPVKAIMSSEVVTCEESTPLAELRARLASLPAGRIPVLRDGEVVGVVTRGDVLRGLGEPEPDRPSEGRNLAATLSTLPGLEPVFEAIQAVGSGFDGVYLVGGSVRDILLGEAHFDVDVAVEGDGIALGDALARALGGRATPHEKFGTAVVRWPDGRVDVATARTEFYAEPAALPTVEHATIRQDLFRRDFTVNAMAVSLKGEDFGRLVDYFGGLADLERGVLRVLHNLSFIDDPTRIFRGIRYENRYGFRMDAHTVALARACVEMGLVGELSSARLRDELEALLSEQSVSASVRRLGDLGLGTAIHPHLATDDETATLLEAADRLRAQHAPDEPAWRLRLAVLARRLPPDELYDWFWRLRLRRRDADLVADAVTVAPRLAELLAPVERPSEARRLIGPHDPVGVLLALALEPDGGNARSLSYKRGFDWLRRYLDELRDVRLEVDGGDLDVLGLHESPLVGEVLGELLRRRLDGELGPGREAELSAARELVDSRLRAAPAPRLS